MLYDILPLHIAPDMKHLKVMFLFHLILIMTFIIMTMTPPPPPCPLNDDNNERTINDSIIFTGGPREMFINESKVFDNSDNDGCHPYDILKNQKK